MDEQINRVKNEKHRTFRKYHWVILMAILFAATLLVDQGAWYFRTSIIPTSSPAPFDGTTLPVLKVAKWTSLSSGEWDATYDQLSNAGKLIPLPTYDPSILKKTTESLGWSSEKDLNIRNAKITFSVPYMGNYKLDGVEYAGSHLAVDIKLPSNTPIYAIGNGTVVKVSEQTSGFGRHIVIRHDNFPSLNDAKAKETYFSSYSHLGSINVSENEVVTKGQYIGKSGETGTATTPHLHFQIDNTNAPWHPYWPFTYQESSAAGLSFTEAINGGLGKDKALETTINPMLYVQKYMNGFSNTTTYTPSSDFNSDYSETDNSDSSTNNDSSTDNFDLPPVGSDSETEDSGNTSDNDIEDQDYADAVTEPIIDEETFVQANSFEILNDGNFMVGVGESIIVRALDENGDIAKNYNPENDIYVNVLLGSVDAPDSLDKDNFKDGEASFTIKARASNAIQLEVNDGSASGQSDVLLSEVFSDVDGESKSYDAISFLKEHDVISGYPDGTFKPDNVVSRVEALKFILNGINSDLITARKLPFPDTSAREWYSSYLATGYNRMIVEGYPDSTFKPANTVNRAEFLKMLLTAMNIEIENNVRTDVYEDVSADEWYAPYVQYGKDKNLLIIKDGKFRPEEGMTRREVAELIYRTILLKISGAPKYSSGIRVSDSSIGAYFS